MKLTYAPYQLELRHRFTISGFSRTATPLMLLQLAYEGFTGYGEASMVPYLGESIATATAFLQQVDTSQFIYPFNFADITAYLDSIAPGQPAIKAAIDIALHDLQGKLAGQPCYKLLGSNPLLMPPTAFTIGMDSPDVIRQKVQQAEGFKIIKVKLGGDEDKVLIQTIRSLTDVPLFVDANQGWRDVGQSIDLCYWLHEQGVVLIEQPMPKTDRDSNARITAQSPIPIIADEAVQGLPDVAKAAGAYHGINIKLMKAGGMYTAQQMIQQARALNLKILIGCMSETSCATLAGAALAPQCDWADLDGPFLTSNNPYQQPSFTNGKWVLEDVAGLGLRGCD